MRSLGKTLALVLVLLFLTSLVTLQRVTVKASPKTITVPDDFPTIQQAIDNANAGDTVFVRSGVYYHDGPIGQHMDGITINKTLSLIGENSNTTILKPRFTNSNYLRSGIHVTADRVTISGFTIDGFVSNFTVRHSTLNSTSYQNFGILIQMDDKGTHVPFGCRIVENNFIGCLDSSIEDFGDSDFISKNNANGGFRVNLWNTIVSENNIIGVTGITVGGSGASSTNVTIKQNNIINPKQQSLLYGIWLNFLKEGPIYIYGNNISGYKNGIWFYSSNCFVHNNNFIGNGVGIYLPNRILTKTNSMVGKGNEVCYNNFLNNNHSVFVDSAYFYPPNLKETNVVGNGTDVVSWDNGLVGNYWNDYNGSGVYMIDANNVDHHPLTQPVDISSPAPTLFSALVIPIIIVVVVLTVAILSLLLYSRHRKTTKLNK
jgi:hypothetical protein